MRVCVGGREDWKMGGRKEDEEKEREKDEKGNGKEKERNEYRSILEKNLPRMYQHIDDCKIYHGISHISTDIALSHNKSHRRSGRPEPGLARIGQSGGIQDLKLFSPELGVWTRWWMGQ